MYNTTHDDRARDDQRANYERRRKARVCSRTKSQIIKLEVPLRVRVEKSRSRIYVYMYVYNKYVESQYNILNQNMYLKHVLHFQVCRSVFHLCAESKLNLRRNDYLYYCRLFSSYITN